MPEICPHCRQEVPGETRHGLCPACLLTMAKSSLPSLDFPEEQTMSAPEAGIGLGDYELLEEVARGGMGVVFRARQRSLQREVAVKMILGGVYASPEAVLRFRREAQAAARLRHPNIVSIYEVGEDEGRQFFSMEYIEGQRLDAAELGQDRRGEPRRVATLLAKIARAIHFAHEHGVLHRDLKPSNILVDAQGEPHVTDFGLAIVLEDLGKAGGAGFSEVTSTGQTLGTPHYLPPEQIGSRRGRVGPGSDIYALGAVLYHLLTGRPPFLGGTVHETLALVESEAPISPRQWAPGLPRDLETVCLKCLEKDPARRYGSAMALADDLERVALGMPIAARRVSAGERLWRVVKRYPGLAALYLALLGSLAAGLSGMTLLWHRAQATAHREAEERERAQRLLDRLDLERAETYLAEHQHDRALASLARAVRRHPGNAALSARLMAALAYESYLLPTAPYMRHEAGVVQAIFSPDGRWILTLDDDDAMHLWDGASSNRRKVSMRGHRGKVREVAFHPEGSLLVSASEDGTCILWTVPDGGRLGAGLRHGQAVTSAVFSGNGDRLATGCDDGKVRIFGVDPARGGQLLAELPQESPVLDVAFGQGGDVLAVGTEDGMARLWRRQGSDYADLRLPHPRKVMQVIFSPDERRLLTVCHDGHWRLWNVADGTLYMDVAAHPVTSSITSAKFDAAGDRIVTCSWDKTAKVFSAGTGELLKGPLIHEAAPVDAVWMREGELLATGGRDNLVRVWDVTLGHLASAPFRHGFLVYSLALNPGGDRLLSASKDGTARLLELRRPSAEIREMRLAQGVSDVALDSRRGRWLMATREGLVWADAEPSEGRAQEAAWRSAQPAMIVARHARDDRWAGADMQGNVVMWQGAGLRSLGSNGMQTLRHGEALNAMAFSPAGHLLLTSGGAVRLWDVNDGRERWRLPREDRFSVARFHPDGSQVVTASWDETARVWDTESGEALSGPMRHDGPVMDACYSEDGRWIATASRDRSARVWRTDDWEPVGRPLPHRHEVQRVVFDPGSKLLATVSLDRQVSLWHVPSGQPALSSPLSHEARVSGLAFSPDGKWLATGTEAGGVRIWSVSEGLSVVRLQAHSQAISKVEFLADGKTLLSASWDGTVRWHELPLCEGVAPAWLPALAEAVAGLRFGETGEEEIVSEQAYFQLQHELTTGGARDEWHRWAARILDDDKDRPEHF